MNDLGSVVKIMPTPAGLAIARASLETACDDLDFAVEGLSEVEGDAVMASPSLIGLLLRVVNARRHVSGLERDAAAEAAELRWNASPQ